MIYPEEVMTAKIKKLEQTLELIREMCHIDIVDNLRCSNITEVVDETLATTRSLNFKP